MGSVTSNPKISVSLLPAAVVDAYADRRDIIFGQNLPTGSAAGDGTLNVNVQNWTTSEIKAFFGATSSLANTVLEWKESNGGYSPLDVIGVEEAGGAVAAASSITFIGTTSTVATSFTIKIVNYTLDVDIAIGDTPTVVGDSIVAAVALLTDPVFTANNVAGVVTFTATDKGLFGNTYSIQYDVTGVPLLGVTLSTVIGWGTAVAGSGTPTLTSILDPIDGIRYTGALWPEAWHAELSIIKTEFESRFNASNTIMDGTIFQGLVDSYADILTALSTENSQTTVFMCSNNTSTLGYRGNRIVKPIDWVSAEFMGIRSRRLTTGAPIADYIISMAGGLDAFGGPSTASLPYFNTPMANVPVTPSSYLFSSTEQAALEAAGATTYGPNTAQNAMLMAPVVTANTTDAGGNANDSFHYLNYVDTGSACREIFYLTLKSTYAQSRLTEGDLVAGRSMANEESIKAELLRIYKFLGTLALTQTGAEAESYFSTNTTVTITLADRLVTISGPLPIVTQVGTINYSLQLAFTVGGTGTQITV